MRFINLIFIALSFAQGVLSWSDLGHRTVALLAQKYLTDSASELFNSILANDRGFDFSDAATWSDTVKRPRPFTKTWHFVGTSPPILSVTDITPHVLI